MLNQSGYALLNSLYPEDTNFAVFLLANFQLDAFTTLHPEKLIKFGVNKGLAAPRTERNLIQKVDDLVAAGFLEYGPFVRGWRYKQTPTVRICQQYLIRRVLAKAIRNKRRERAERVGLVFSA